MKILPGRLAVEVSGEELGCDEQPERREIPVGDSVRDGSERTDARGRDEERSTALKEFPSAYALPSCRHSAACYLFGNQGTNTDVRAW